MPPAAMPAPQRDQLDHGPEGQVGPRLALLIHRHEQAYAADREDAEAQAEEDQCRHDHRQRPTQRHDAQQEQRAAREAPGPTTLCSPADRAACAG